MATPTVLQFMQKTAEDQQLQQQLGTLLGVGDGDISSQAELDVAEAEALKGDRAPAVVDFAARLGFVFSVEELRTIVDAFQRYQVGEISEEELGKLLGLSTQDKATQENLPSIKQAVELIYRGTRYHKIDGRLVPIGQPIPSKTPKVLQFMQKTAEDQRLRQQLGAILGVGDGDISSQIELDLAEAEALMGDRAPAVVKFAAKQGFVFSVEELRATVDAFQRYQTGEISEEELEKLIGLSTQDQAAHESLPSVKQTVELLYRGTRYQKIDGRLIPVGQPIPSKAPKVLQFMQKTAENQRLRQQLGSILGVGDGDISSQIEIDVAEAEALKGDRAPAVVKFAAKQGFVFSVEELRATVDAFQRYQMGEISEEELEKLIGLSTQDQTSQESLPSVKQTVELLYRGTRYQKIDGRLVPIGKPGQPTKPQVLQFMQKTAEDERLRQQLGALLGVGDGDISNQAEVDVNEAEALTGERAPAVVGFAAKQGFVFSVEELRTTVDAFQRYQAGELSDDEFAKLIGLSSLNQDSKESFPAIKKIVDFVQRSIRNRK
jgi:Ca2+-binding EF-hand superfamily protein